MAKTETNCKNESFVALIWKFSYSGLNLDLESVLRLFNSVESLYSPMPLSYLIKAFSSFWSPIPVYWATTIDLNPVALSPSASKPHIPKTERIDILKMYGDAEVTVSTTRSNVAPATPGSGFAGVLWTLYVIWVLLGTVLITYWPS